MAMTAQQKRQVGWASVVAGLAAALTVATFVARAVAAEQVRPVEQRVAKVETAQEGSEKRLDRMERKLDRVLERLGVGKERE